MANQSLDNVAFKEGPDIDAPEEGSDQVSDLIQPVYPSSFASPLRRATGSQTSAKAKSALSKLIKQVCPITGEDYPLEVVHLVARDMKTKPELGYLENWLGKVIHLDSRFNLMYLTKDYREAFDDGHWALLPSIAVLKEMLKSFENATTPPTNKWHLREVEYYFTPILKKFPSRSIFRKTALETPDKEAEYQRFNHPFADFPVLKMHMDPHFVVYNAAPKLMRGRTFFNAAQLERAVVALLIWSLWTTDKPDWPRASWSRSQSEGGASEAGPKDSRNSRRDKEDDGDGRTSPPPPNGQTDPSGPNDPNDRETPPFAGNPRSGTPHQTLRVIPELDDGVSNVDESQESDDEQSTLSDVLDWVRIYSSNVDRKIFPHHSSWEDLDLDLGLYQSANVVASIPSREFDVAIIHSILSRCTKTIEDNTGAEECVIVEKTAQQYTAEDKFA